MIGYFLVVTIMAVAVAMDAFTIAITYGMEGIIRTVRQRIKMALIFSFFQGFLFAMGIVLYQFVSGDVTKYNSFAAGVILISLGVRNLFDGIHTHSENNNKIKGIRITTLAIMGIATSIDALAAGITYGLIYSYIVSAIVIVTVVAFVLTYMGATFGQKIGYRIGNKAAILGGVVIIMLGVKSLFG